MPFLKLGAVKPWKEDEDLLPRDADPESLGRCMMESWSCIWPATVRLRREVKKEDGVSRESRLLWRPRRTGDSKAKKEKRQGTLALCGAHGL